MFGSGGYIGGFIGFLMGYSFGGFIFAILGSLLGSSIERSLRGLGSSGSGFKARGFSGHPGGFSAAQNSSRVFFSSVFSMLGKLSLADGTITTEERAVITKFMRDDLRLDPSSQQSAMDIFNAAARSGESFESYARTFYQTFRGNAQFIELLLDILLRLACADGSIHPAEEKMLLQAISIFNYSEDSYERIKSRYMGGGSYTGGQGRSGSSSQGFKANQNSYSILGCSPNDSDSDVKKAYRKKVNEFHPDKIAAKGLPEEFTAFAKKQFQDIQNAWDAIRKERSI